MIQHRYSKLPARAQLALLAALANAGTPHEATGAVSSKVGAPTLDFTNSFVHPETGRILSTGLTPSDDDVRDYSYVPTGRTPLYEMDFRSECPPIRDQGQVGACTAFHVDSHCGRYAKRAGWPTMAYSTRANYAMSRQLMGLTGDSGATLRAAIHAAYKYGLPTEEQFPYGTDWQAIVNTTTLPDAIMQAAAQNKIDAYYRVDVDLKDTTMLRRRINRALADGYTVGIGMYLHYWFYFVKGPLSTHADLRKHPLPGYEARWSNIIGAHAMVIVGRSDSLGGYIVRNQWGTGWGDAGYYLMPYADTGEAFEFWTVAGFDGSDITYPTRYDVNCSEAKAARLYRVALNRYPDAEGLAWYTTMIDDRGPQMAATVMCASDEFQKLYGPMSADAYVTALYRNAFYREPDAAGKAYWVNALSSGLVDKDDVAFAFAESDEMKAVV